MSLNAPTLDAALPEDIWELIGFFLGIEDIKNFNCLNTFFKHLIEKSHSTWRGLINHHFSYLNNKYSARRKFQPKALFREEFEKWKLIAQDLNIPLSAILAVLQGKLYAVDQTNLTMADIKILILLNAAIKNDTVGLTSFEDELVQSIRNTILRIGKISPICSSRIESQRDATLEKVPTLLTSLSSSFFCITQIPNTHALFTLCQAHCIGETDSPDKISVFDIINELSEEELMALRSAYEEIVVMMISVEELATDQKQVFNKVFNIKARNEEFVKLCQELYTPEELNKESTSPIRYGIDQFQTYQQLLEHLLQNLPMIYSDIIIKKIEKSLATRKNQGHTPTLTTQFGLTSSASNNNNNNNPDDKPRKGSNLSAKA